jgi:queuine tRNA-ribosyltransferase
MGLGEPVDILDSVGYGYDMFDCVLPTRNGRNGQAFTAAGSMNIRNSRFSGDRAPVEEDCTCYCCRNFSRGYVRHLFNTGEALGPALLSIHNISFFMEFMRKIRESVEAGSFAEFKTEFIQKYYQGETP